MTNDQETLAAAIHELYNSLAEADDPKTIAVRSSLLKAYRHLPERDAVAVADKLAKYLYFVGYTEKIPFSTYQQALIAEISRSGQHAGVNGSYRAWYGDERQF